MRDRIKKYLVEVGLLSCFALLTWSVALASYPAPVFKAVGVYSEESGTNFWAFITGPSPEDVASFTVTGPSGTFNLQTSLSFRQLGLLYFHGEGSILEDGSYTFLVTDGLGRTASVVKDFAYDHAFLGKESFFYLHYCYWWAGRGGGIVYCSVCYGGVSVFAEFGIRAYYDSVEEGSCFLW